LRDEPQFIDASAPRRAFVKGGFDSFVAGSALTRYK
jgi:hypothetical protein